MEEEEGRWLGLEEGEGNWNWAQAQALALALVLVLALEETFLPVAVRATSASARPRCNWWTKGALAVRRVGRL
jgi:hypothetical protein